MCPEAAFDFCVLRVPHTWSTAFREHWGGRLAWKPYPGGLRLPPSENHSGGEGTLGSQQVTSAYI